MKSTSSQIAGLSPEQIRLLARRARTLGRKPTAEPCLVPIRAQGRKLPLFLIHPAGAMCYHELALRLDQEQPVYGLQEPLFEDLGDGFVAIEDMAARYIHEIRRVHNGGPYRLGGWSLGGIVAFEMARQLAAAGEQIELLLMIDTGAPLARSAGTPDSELRKNEGTLSMLHAHLGELMNVADPSAVSRRLGAYLGLTETVGQNSESGGSEEQEKRLIDTLIAKHGLQVDSAYLQRLGRVLRSQHRAVRSYSPSKYSGAMLLIRATDPHPYPELEEVLEQRSDLTLGWGSYISGPITIQEIRGNHYTVMARDRMVTLAGIISSHLT
jgi:thioesterase domain-containing protein